MFHASFFAPTIRFGHRYGLNLFDKEDYFMSEFHQPASPNEGPESLPTPEVDVPASPSEGPENLPTPALPTAPTQPVRPIQPTQPIQRACPAGFRRGTVQNNQSFTDLLIENNVSYNAMRAANPALSTNRLSPGTVYCAPPSGSRRLCANAGRSYVMSQGETLYTLTRTLGISAGRLLIANPSLAPGDFLPGQMICLP